MIKYIISLLSKQLRRKIILLILNDIVESKDDSIDKKLTESILTYVAKSSGNNLTSFVLDK